MVSAGVNLVLQILGDDNMNKLKSLYKNYANLIRRLNVHKQTHVLRMINRMALHEKEKFLSRLSLIDLELVDAVTTLRRPHIDPSSSTIISANTDSPKLKTDMSPSITTRSCT